MSIYDEILGNGFSMVSKERLLNLYNQCIQFKDTNYSFVECGVAKGGCLALMAHSAGSNNKIYGFDSFEGMPDITNQDLSDYNKSDIYNGFGKVGDNLSGGIENVYKTFETLKVSMQNVTLVKGFFKDTLNIQENIDSIENIGILRLDGDWYESTKICLEKLYDKVVIGGVIIIDDYGHWIGAKLATDEFRNKNNIISPLWQTDYTEHCWVKTDVLFPITFSIPMEKICNICIEKTKILSNLIPGDMSTYIYNTEEDYYNEYQKSYFAITTKKSGWDCMRHYEILANGCVPLFYNIEACPKNTMFILPKDLFIEGNQLYTKFQNKTLDEINDDLIKEYYTLQKKLLEYTKNFLTTDKIANYVLEKTNHTKVDKILLLSGNLYSDYLKDLTLHGLKRLKGSNCHDFPKIPHMYTTYDGNQWDMYGKGFSYSRLLEPTLHNDSLDTTLIEDIKNKYYDIIIYGSYHRGMPHYDLISTIYKPSEVILLCGEDCHWCDNSAFLKKKNFVFVREI